MSKMTMRDALSVELERIVERFAAAFDDRTATLELHDALANMIDVAEEHQVQVTEPGPTAEVHADMIRDMLNELTTMKLRHVRKAATLKRKPAKVSKRKTGRKK